MAVVIALGAAGLVLATSDAWKTRISTIETYDQESSAETRIGVWIWTLQFVSSRPQGGGFMAFVTNHFQLASGRDIYGHAFHSIYFEVLGEHGWLGLAIFLGLIFNTLLSLWRVMWRTRSSPNARLVRRPRQSFVLRGDGDPGLRGFHRDRIPADTLVSVRADDLPQ